MSNYVLFGDNSFWFSGLQDFLVIWIKLRCYPSGYNSRNMNSNHFVPWMLSIPCVRNIETQIHVWYIWSKHKQNVYHTRLHGHSSPIRVPCSFSKIYQLFGTFWHCRIDLQLFTFSIKIKCNCTGCKTGRKITCNSLAIIFVFKARRNKIYIIWQHTFVLKINRIVIKLAYLACTWLVLLYIYLWN